MQLSKKDLMSLVNGQSPYYDLFDHPIVKTSGDFSASHGIWNWHSSALEKLSEQQLWDLYVMCRDSWKS